jgi:hypothetical protein
MKDETYISESAALAYLRTHGEFTHEQARCVLHHAKRREIFGGLYFPLRYIAKRAEDNAARSA